MAVTTFLNYKEYLAEGISTRFCIPFLLLDRADLNVFIDNQLIISGYTITGLGNPSGEIIFDEAPKGVLLLQRTVSLLRETDYQENGDLLAETLNRDFDRLYLAMQGVSQNISQSLRVPDPEGVSILPLSNERANKLLSFDSFGQPVLVEANSGSAMELAQQLKNSDSQNKGGGLVGYNDLLSYPTKTIGCAMNRLAKRFDEFEGNSVPLFAVFWWPSRESIPAGYVTADGQELSQGIFPDAFEAIKQGKVPVVSELDWKNNSVKRGAYVANSSDGMFRVPDYNGMYTDSIGALFLRGDNGSVSNGEIQKDAIRNITGTVSQASSYSPTGAFYAGTGAGYTAANYTSGTITEMDVSRVVPVANENRPVNICGCWVIKLFSSVINTGSANIQQIVAENAKLAAKLSVLEGAQEASRFTIIYPNEGTEENPANVINNKYYEMDNPFPGHHVICIAELLINGNWGDPGWIMIYAAGGGSYGVKASMLNMDKIIVRTGSARIMGTPSDTGAAHSNGTPLVSSASCRVKVWRVI